MNVPLLLIGTGSGFAHSLYSVVSKYAIKERVRTPFLFLLYINVFQACISPVLWLGAAPTCPSAEVVLPLLIAGLTCALAYGFLYSSLSRGDVSSVMPIMGSKVIFSAFLARLMLKEGHGWPIYMAILLVAVSIATLSYSPTEGQTSRFRMKPIVLMLICCLLFSITDVFIKKSLLHIDTYNFLIYYNIIVGIASLLIIPTLKSHRISLRIDGATALVTLITAALLLIATLLFVMALNMADGVVIPNILMATRGVFIVLISFVLTHRGSTALDTQSKSVYAFRFAASLLIVLSIGIAMKG